MNRDLVFSALADPSRRLLLDRLRLGNGQTLSALGDGLAMTRQAVSKHLRVLEGAGLVVARKAGRERRHYLNPVPLHTEVRRWLDGFDATPLDALVTSEGA
jgi:DNA-binding transcriptional ArsR family regulator